MVLMLGIVVGAVLVRRWWPRIEDHIVMVDVLRDPDYTKRRYNLVFATDYEEEIQELWQRVVPRGEGIMELFDGTSRVAVKVPNG